MENKERRREKVNDDEDATKSRFPNHHKAQEKRLQPAIDCMYTRSNGVNSFGLNVNIIKDRTLSDQSPLKARSSFVREDSNFNVWSRQMNIFYFRDAAPR